MASSAQYRIMQYNILHEGYASQEYLNIGLETRKNNVVNAIKAVSPNVLFLAERFEEWDAIGNNSVDLMSSLGSDYAIVENRVTYPLADGGTKTVTNRTPIVYNTNTFQLVDSGYLFLTEEVSTEVSNNKRGVTWAVLEDVTKTNRKGYQIAVFSTHWSTNTHWRSRESLAMYKQAQASEMQALINGKRFNGLPIVVGGDFNVTYAEYEYYKPYQWLLERCHLIDVASAISENPANTVDHIAVSQQFQVQSFCFQDVSSASDHLPIYCNVNYMGD